MDKLIKRAIEARKMAYTPYSKFKVGAALEATDGKIYSGCNIENASYGLAICAERVALFKAVSDGVRKIRRIAVVTGAKKRSAPCGACRQVLAEFNPRMGVILANTSGKSRKTNLSRLLPNAFLRKSLN